MNKSEVAAMNTISLKCPHCGAPLKFSSGQTIIKCTYCESAIYLLPVAQPQTAAPANEARPQSSGDNLTNLIEVARKAIDNNMYDRAYEVYNQILLAEPGNLEADLYSQILYLKSHLKNYSDFSRYEYSDKAKAFINEVCAADISDGEKFDVLRPLFFLLGDVAIEVDSYIRDEFEGIDTENICDIFSIRYIILDMADRLCELYPDNELFKSVYINEWTVQLIWIKDKERIKAVKESLKRYNADATDMTDMTIKTAQPNDKSGCMGCLGALAVLFFICLLIGSCGHS